MKNYRELIVQYVENTISPKDRETLKSWIEEKEEHKYKFTKEIEKWSAAKEEIFVDPNKAYHRFATAINEKRNTKTATSLRYGKIIIKDEVFFSVIKRLEKAYGVEITSANERLNNTRFTGEFDIENVQEILEIFSKTVDFTYDIEDNKITINP